MGHERDQNAGKVMQTLNVTKGRVAAAEALAAIRAQAELERQEEERSGEDVEPGEDRGGFQYAGDSSAEEGDCPELESNGDKDVEYVAGRQVIDPSFLKLQGKRRVRRPFSVAEVEALVSAVERLGTGRWRDVKVQAFAHSKHRTYVDLKDKWKTLVHTAQIAPQQRRGVPVPDGLLGRVTHAAAFWGVRQLTM